MPLQNQTFADSLWITPVGAKTSMDGNRMAWFSLDFTLPDSLDGIETRLCITAQTRYKLRVNGLPVTVGPRKGNPSQHFFERLELTQHVRPGKNSLLVQVVSYAPLIHPDNMGLSPISVLTLPLEAALLAAGGVFDGDKCLIDFASGKADWRAVNEEGIEWLRHPQTHYVGALERWDAAKLSCRADGHDADRPAAAARWTPQINPYGEMPPMILAERTIPLLLEKDYSFTREMPCENRLQLTNLGSGGETAVPPHSVRAIELDAGELTTGYMRLAISGGAGARVRIRYAECYRAHGPDGKRIKAVRDEPCAGGLDEAFDELLSCGGEYAFESFWYRTFRFVRIEIETADEPLHLHTPYYRRTHYPLAVQASLESSADWVAPLWEVNVRTLLMCMHETHEDCPFYEQLQYTSDTKLQMDFTYAISTDLRMARQVVDDFHHSLLPDGMLQSRTPSQHRQAIPQFGLYFIHMLLALYEQDGDAEFVRRYRPTADAVLDYFDRHVGGDGLVRDLGYWDFADWIPAWQHGVPDAVWQGPSTIHNLVYAYTLGAAASLAHLTGRPDTAAEYAARSAAILAALRTHCFDTETGLLREGPSVNVYTQHAQVFAALAGFFDDNQAAGHALRASVTRDDIIKCTYPQQFYLLRALEQTGLYDLSVSVWSDLAALLPLNITTLPEMPANPRSDCHAWSALMLYDAPRVWLGVRPSAPAWNGITVRPHPLPGLNDLSGSVPTPHGPVTVRWKRTDAGISLSVDAPRGVPLTVISPNRETRLLPDGGCVEMGM